MPCVVSWRQQEVEEVGGRLRVGRLLAAGSDDVRQALEQVGQRRQVGQLRDVQLRGDRGGAGAAVRRRVTGAAVVLGARLVLGGQAYRGRGGARIRRRDAGLVGPEALPAGLVALGV